MSIPYGRLNALAAALGGWEAIEAAYAAGTPLVGGGSRRTIACPFAYNTPNLLTGAVVYTPTPGDIIYNAWIEVNTGWNGTTPKGDFGLFAGHPYGWLAELAAWVSMAVGAEDLNDGTYQGLISNNALGTGAANDSTDLYGLTITAPITAGPSYEFGRAMPARIADATPIKVCVSTTGRTNGADPGSTQGAAVLYLDISTPQAA